jgi:DnaK suppressor protein
MERERKAKKQPARRPKARAADVLGNTVAGDRVRRKWQKYYRRLVELRNYLVNRRGDLAKDASEEKPNFSMHMADAGTDTFDRDFALSMMSLEQDGLYEIDQALSRIQLGTYGICELTGKRIEPERLEAIPWTRFSADAERQLEREGGAPRAKLGPREEVVKRTAAAEEAAMEEEDEKS